jgi:hypothetical protein
LLGVDVVELRREIHWLVYLLIGEELLSFFASLLAAAAYAPLS